MFTEQSVFKKMGSLRLVLLILFLIIVIVALFFYFFSNTQSFKSNNGLALNSELKEVKLVKLEKDNLVLSADSYPIDSIFNISNFEQDKNLKWQGGGVLDDKLSYEGDKSLSLVSINHNEVVSYAKKDIDLSNAEYLELMVNVSDYSALESAVLQLGDLDQKNYYQYTFTNLGNGWNLVQIPKNLFVPFISQEGDFSWQKIQNIQIKIVGRMGQMVIVHFDAFNAINNSNNFARDWSVYGDKQKMFFSLFNNSSNEKKQLLVRNYGAGTGVLENKRNIKNFILSAKISPQSTGRSGLFVRGNYNNSFGYYFLIGGDRSNQWQITKINKNGWLSTDKMINGDIGNEVFQRGKDYWIRVEGRGDNMGFFLSFDGNRYYKLGEMNDSEFKSGGLGVTVQDGSQSTFDNIMVKEL